MNFLRRLIGQRPIMTKSLSATELRTDQAAITAASATANPQAGVAQPTMVQPPASQPVPTKEVPIAANTDALAATAPLRPVADDPVIEVIPTEPVNLNGAQTLGGVASRQDDTPYPAGTRQLPEMEVYVPRPNRHVVYGVNTDIGMVRSNNQDALYAMFSVNVSAADVPDFGLFIVADGMGGHHDGEKASATASRVIGKHLVENFYLKLLNHREDADKPIISEVMNEAFHKANDAVAESVPEGGTTATAMVLLGDLAYFGHVGDSRAYILTSEGCEQITRDHSLVQRLIELDQLTPEEALTHPQRNVLYRALGQNEMLEVDTITRRVPAGSRIVLCSDGLWNEIPEFALQQIIHSSKTPQDASDRLIQAAKDRGGRDNITAITIQIP